MNVTLLNSWQSDSDHNRKAIRTALREACTNAESQISDLHIKVDEATSNQVGALHIPNAVLENISKADVFIVDLSTIGVSFNGSRKIQNPNVLIELGYAISQLGWDRIILLFNKEYGDFNDMPFDIEKRCCIDFKISSEADRNGIGQLRENLSGRIVEIIQTNPEKPTLKTVVENKSRTNDVKTIMRILTWMPVQEMDSFLKHGRDKVKKSLTDNINRFCDFVESLTFHVTDERLRRRIYALYDQWQDMIERMKRMYTLKGTDYVNNSVLKGTKRRSQTTDYFIDDIDKAYVSLLKLIRSEYPEIDVYELDVLYNKQLTL